MPSIFISYRVLDQPLGAATICESLAGEFGPDQVFRDCVSMSPGTDYPTAIRDALASADVLLAVIGPLWLKITDDTGARLIDREADWVRRELATTFQRGIPVLPVLLKDTPDNATLPAQADLPDDIKPLAFRQTVAVSHRNLKRDLARLAEAVASLLPSLTPRRAAFFELVDAMEQVDCLARTDTRNLVVERLPSSISGAIQYHGQRRAHLISILGTCLNYANGLNELLTLITELDGVESLPLRRLRTMATRLYPGSGSSGVL